MTGLSDDERRVRAHLLSRFNTFVRRLGLDLTPDAREFVLTEVIPRGSRRLVSEGSANDADALKRADSQLMSLVFRAATGEDEVRFTRPPPRTDLVERRNLEETLFRLCPGF
jgi:hypothetical protein